MDLTCLFEIFNREIKKIYFKVKYGKRIVYKKKFKFRSGFKIVIEKDGNLKLGKRCFFNNYCSINCMSNIVIGDYCIFGENVKLYDHNHCYLEKDKPIADQGFKTSDIIIGNNCWIGSNCVILPGVTIGDHCVIGAGCIVYKDVPHDSVVINGNQLIIKKMKEI